jgi:hypothetical protein
VTPSTPRRRQGGSRRRHIPFCHGGEDTPTQSALGCQGVTLKTKVAITTGSDGHWAAGQGGIGRRVASGSARVEEDYVVTTGGRVVSDRPTLTHQRRCSGSKKARENLVTCRHSKV